MSDDKKKEVVYNKDGTVRKDLGRKASKVKANQRVVSYLTDNELNELKEIAENEDRTISFVIRKAVQEFIKIIEIIK